MEEKSIIIVGASNKRERFANKAVRAYRDLGWTVYPVHPTETEVEGIACSPTVAEVPGRASTMSLYVPPAAGLAVVGGRAGEGRSPTSTSTRARAAPSWWSRYGRWG